MAVLADLSACADHVSTGIKPCPCAAGNVCCDSGVCAKDQSACPAATRALSETAEGEWTGYFENFFQISSDDSFRLSISLAGDGSLSGQVVVGNGPLPVPPTDADQPWPATRDPLNDAPATIPGFVYQLHGIHWQAQRLQFKFFNTEPWGPWCALQQSYSSAGGLYSCIPGGALLYKPDFPGSTRLVPVQDSQGNCMSDTTPPLPVPCYKEGECGSQPYVCYCDAGGCGPTTEDCQNCEVVPGVFDIAVRNGIGDGTAYLPYAGSFNVRLTHASQ